MESNTLANVIPLSGFFSVGGLSRRLIKDCDQPVIITNTGSIYHTEAVIGAGGLSQVYRARRFSDGQVVALKLANLKNCQQAVDFLRREVEIILKFAHPNVVKVFEAGETSHGIPFIAMELLQGETLDQVLCTKKNFPLLEAASLCVQIAGALDYMHAQGIVHRDIKPANIMLVEKESGPYEAKIFDFGISMSIVEENKELSSSGSLLYATPEQFAEQAPSIRSDVYQLALVCVELMTGKLPFDKTMEQAMKYRLEGPLLPKESEAVLPDAVRTVLSRALAREAKERYGSMSLFANLVYKAVKHAQMALAG